MDILLIPGFMLDADLWRETRPGLERFGRIVDVDTTQDDSIEAMADRAVATMDGPAVVIGFSMGGYVARQIAYRAKDRVRGLALIATSSRPERPRTAPVQASMHFRSLSRAAIASSAHPDHLTDALVERVQAMSVRLGDPVFQRQSRLDRDGDADRLTEIRCPTAVVAAADDQLRSLGESIVLHKGIVGSTLTVIADSGHLIPLEQPDALIAALETLLAAAIPPHTVAPS